MQIGLTSGEDNWAKEALYVSNNNHYWKRDHLEEIYLKWEPEYHRPSLSLIGILFLNNK